MPGLQGGKEQAENDERPPINKKNSGLGKLEEAWKQGGGNTQKSDLHAPIK
jgi:hypothetical protein